MCQVFITVTGAKIGSLLDAGHWILDLKGILFITTQVVWFRVQDSRLILVFSAASSYLQDTIKLALNYRDRLLGVSKEQDKLGIRLRI